MKLLVFGATGGTGRALVEQALEQGHTVTAFARNPAKVRTTHPNLRVIKGDILDYGSVELAVQGQDAVLSALGVKVRWQIILIVAFVCQLVPKAVVPSKVLGLLVGLGIPFLSIFLVSRTKPVLSKGTANIVQAMEKLRVRRFICESSLGVGDSKGELGSFYSYVVVPLFLRSIFADKERQEGIIKGSTLDWVIVRPARLTNAPWTGKYYRWTGVSAPPISGKISRADVADFMLEQLFDSTFLRKVVGLSS